MPYTLTKSDGNPVATVADATKDITATSISLIGKNFAGYGDEINQNMIYMLENFAKATPPTAPMLGQIWWDSANSTMKVCTNAGSSTWKAMGSSTVSSTTPLNPLEGDTWWDSTSTIKQLKVYDGTTWQLVGPQFAHDTVAYGAVGTSVELNGTHTIVKISSNGSVVAIISKDAEFVPSPAITGFASIKPGITLASTGTIPNIKFNGTASNADSLGGIPAASYATTASLSPMTAALSIVHNDGLTYGATGQGTLKATGDNVFIRNTTVAGTMTLSCNGVAGLVMAADGKVTVAAAPTVDLGICTKKYTDDAIAVVAGASGSALARAGGVSTITGVIVPDANNTRDFGASGTRFNTIYATTFNGTSFTGTAAVASSLNSTALGTANIWTAAQTFNINGVPVIVDSELLDTKIQFKRDGTSTGYIGSNLTRPFIALNEAGTLTLIYTDTTGNFTAAANVSAYSDERLKKDWADLPVDFVDRLAKVKHGTYDRTDITQRQVGVSAQSLQQVLPEAVMTGDDGMLSVAYGNAALAACVALAKEILELRAEIKELKNGN